MRTTRRVLALSIAGMLVLGAAVASPALADDGPDWQTMPGFPVTVGDVSVEFQSASSATSPFGGQELLEPMLAYRPVIVNDSDETKTFGFGTDFVVQGQIDELWTPEAWGVFGELAEGSGLLELFVLELAPFTTSAGSGGWDNGMPSWSGHTITVFELIADPEDPEADPTAVPIASVTTPGRFVAANLDNANINIDNLSAAMGKRLSVAGVGTPDLFSGVAGTATASGLPAGEQVELWVVEDFNYAFFQIIGGGLPVGSVKVGTGTVAADGTLSAVFSLPLGLAENNTPYQMVAGIPGERYWPAGTWDDFRVNPAPNGVLQSTPVAPAGGVEASFDFLVLDDFALSATVTFPEGSSAGQSSAVYSATGPLPAGFQLMLDPPLYVHISTTVELSGQAQVCLTYDAAVYDAPSLFHYDSTVNAWVDITDSYGVDVVCGFTSSFSPFVLGYPDETGFAFDGFYKPVNMTGENVAKAGQAIPVKFSLGGDQGTDAVTSARFVIAGVDTTPEGTVLPTTTAGNSGLTYDAASDTYTYVWKTQKAWASKTGRFELTLSDGSVHGFEVTFRK